MIQRIDYTALIAFFDHLVQSGEQLALCWNGGGDTGEYQLKHNGEIIEIEDERLNQLFHRACQQLGHYGFDGEYYCEGSASYDPQTKRFDGIDRYSRSDTATAKCEIPLEIPSELWFDQLEITLESDNDNSIVIITLLVKNGPLSPAHEQIQTMLTEIIDLHLSAATGSVRDFECIWDRTVIDRKDFEPKGDLLVHTIKEFECQTTQIDVIPVFIKLKEEMI